MGQRYMKGKAKKGSRILLSPKKKLNKSQNSARSTGQRKLKTAALPVDESDSECQVSSALMLPNNNVHVEDKSITEEGYLVSSRRVVRRNYSLINNPFKCSPCNLSFKSVSQLRQHNVVHSKIKDSSSTKSEISVDSVFKCDKCERSFKYLRNLNCHKKVHLRARKTTLKDVVSIIKNSQEKSLVNPKPELVSVHKLSSESPRNEGIYPCSICDEKFYCLNKMREHEAQHVEHYADIRRFLSQVVKESSVHTKCKDLPPRFRCSICKNEFDCAADLEVHYVQVHLNLQLFICSICNITFTEKDSYDKHVKSHTLIKEYKLILEGDKSIFQCDICRKTFKLVKNLKSHQKICFKNIKSENSDFVKKMKNNHHKVKKSLKLKKSSITIDTSDSKNASQCHLCLKNFSSVSAVKCHVSKMHGSRKGFNQIIEYNKYPRHVVENKGESKKNIGHKSISKDRKGKKSKAESVKSSTKIDTKVKKRKVNKGIVKPKNINTENPLVIRINHMPQIEPNIMYNFPQPTMSFINTTTSPNVQYLTVSKNSTQTNSVITPKFNFDSEEYIVWLKSLINKCKSYTYPLPLTTAKIVGQVSDDLFDALITPEGSLKKKENHFYLLKFYQTISSIMLQHAKHYLTPD